jgi:hypothetical protein
MKPTVMVSKGADRASDLVSNLGTPDLAQLRELAIEKAGEVRRYVSRKGARGVAQDAVAVAKEHPVAAAATALGIAYLASRLIRR